MKIKLLWGLTAGLVGAVPGLVIVALAISNAPSYLSDEPEACINCHIMRPEYATWARSSHAGITTCNDCHVPQSFPRGPIFKAKDGARHAWVFTLGTEPQVITVNPTARDVVHENCVRCHGNMLASESLVRPDRPCFECHREVPHGRVHGLASSPHARVPRFSPLGGSPPKTKGGRQDE